jgi:hypothetical protein
MKEGPERREAYLRAQLSARYQSEGAEADQADSPALEAEQGEAGQREATAAAVSGLVATYLSSSPS